MSTRLWDRAGHLPIPVDGRRRAEVAVLPAGLPDLAPLFTFMRDAELRFQTLRMRIEETTAIAAGERLVAVEIALRHPGTAKVTRTDPSGVGAADYEIWISDGATVRTYASRHRLGTERPVRRSIVGLEDPDLPATSKVYRPVTPLPMDSLAETFVHPAGFCQNVLTTGRCWISGTTTIAGREAIVIECDHPRTIEMAADRPDHHLQVTVDRDTGVIVRLLETIGGVVTRDAVVTNLVPDAPIPPSALDFTIPSGATRIY